MNQCVDKELGLLLHAYELKTLSDDDIERFEIHLMKCPYCFARVTEFDRYASVMQQSRHVREMAAAADQNPAASGSRPPSLWQRLWPQAPLLLRPGIIYILLLIAILPAIYGIRNLTGRSDQFRPVQEIWFNGNRDIHRATFSIGSGLDGVLNFTLPGATSGKNLCLKITRLDGSEIARCDNFDNFRDDGTGRMIIRSDKIRTMGKGTYILKIADPADTLSTGQLQYRFDIID